MFCDIFKLWNHCVISYPLNKVPSSFPISGAQVSFSLIVHVKDGIGSAKMKEKLKTPTPTVLKYWPAEMTKLIDAVIKFCFVA